ncbi:MAG: transcription elongation factor Spt5 [Candidatus Aenigmatarchaeota archaeon]
MIYTVKTVVGRENIVLDIIASKAKAEGFNIKALIHPEEIKGYIFVEGDIKDIEKSIQLIPHVRGLIKKPVEVSEIQKFLQPKQVEVEINIGDLIEVIGGPFKGMKGKVTRYDKIKREVTIEPLEVAVPIPVTISVEFIKVLEKVSK